jgi:NTP pyrophosphatase (non-canonical NTP hydrolase)
MNLQLQILNLQELFGQRNAMYLKGQRLFFLLEATRIFAKHIRKKSPKPHLESSLASVFSWTCAVADEFKDLPILDAMREKFPPGRCAYCGGPVCVCHIEKRKDIVLALPDAKQLEWSANDWAANLMSVYGESNRKNGMQFVIGRLYEEIGETSSAQLLDVYRHNMKLDAMRKSVSHELADVFSWILVISGMLEIDLDAVLCEKYAGVHYRCGQRPCNCGPQHVHHEDPHPYVVRRLGTPGTP